MGIVSEPTKFERIHQLPRYTLSSSSDGILFTVWEVCTSLPAGCGRCSRRGRREGVDACGAAAQAAIVTGEGSSQVPGFLLLDVTPLSMCLETSLRVATKLYERNTDNLTKSGQTSGTCADNRPGVLTRVFEGVHVTAQDDNLLEKLHPQFDHDDANRISNVSAQVRPPIMRPWIGPRRE